ncbi:MAG TPA: peptidoglycan recognition family protein [Bryobacteraceae bacterium]|nr:peptidoglycan recognition family protein [Bryobacteraceae bacterium]
MSNLDIKWIGCAPNNFRPGRPPGSEVTAIVIHIIDGSRVGADATFLDNTLADPRSAHYSVGVDGTVHQYVKECDTAFHAGVVVNPVWKGLKKNALGEHVNPNSYTIGIEHEGKPEDEWTDAMYASSAALLGEISGRYPALKVLTRENVIMHREIRADKACPGFKVDMDRLIAEASARAESTRIVIL